MSEEHWRSNFVNKPGGSHSYITRLIQDLDAIQPGLWNRLEHSPALDDESMRYLLREFLSRACESSNFLQIHIGQWGAAAMDRSWVLANIEAVAEEILQRNQSDEWEWSRLMEIYEHLDADLTRRFAKRAMAHDNEEIRDLGKQYFQ